MGKANGYPSVTAYIKHFGSWTQALIEAGLDTFHVYTKEFLISELLRAYHELGKTPTQEYMCKKNGYPSYIAYVRIFGSFNDALLIAGLPLNKNTHITKEMLIQDIKQAAIDLARTPTCKDMCNRNGHFSSLTVEQYFGTFNKALIAAGLKLNHIEYIYDNTEKCSICNSTKTVKWHHVDDTLLCYSCYMRIWRKNNPEKQLQYQYNRKGFGFTPLNNRFINSEGHHLHLENSADWVVFIPVYLHKMFTHRSNRPKTMTTINAIALDYLINEDFYNSLIDSYV